MATFIGFLSGIIGGMGIGGGIILIPMLTMLLSVEQKIAQSTNLISYLPLALASLWNNRNPTRFIFGSSLAVASSSKIICSFPFNYGVEGDFWEKVN